MKKKNGNLALVLTLTLATFSSPVMAARKGGDSGGGGDAEEARVNEIRSDILSWIQKGGARELVLPSDISLGEYEDNMTGILEKQKVAIAFTDETVRVNGVEKTCRGAFVIEKGFFSEKKTNPQILCNLTRFKNTEESKQYPLIHHEFAGLVNIEKNDGAASDYEISNQITDFLEVKSVKKLAVKKKPVPAPVVDTTLKEDIVKSIRTFKKDEALTECRPYLAQLENDHTEKLKESNQAMVEAILFDYTDSNKLPAFEKVERVKISTNKSQDKKETFISSEYLATVGDETISFTINHRITGEYKKEYTGKVVNFVDKLGRLKKKELHCSIQNNFEVEDVPYYSYESAYRAAQPKHNAEIVNTESNHRLYVKHINLYLEMSYRGSVDKKIELYLK